MAHYRLTIGSAAGPTRPGPTNTGATGTLTVRSGDQTITTADTLLEDLDIYGRVFVRAANVTIRNCRIRGGPTGSCLIDATSTSCTGLTVEDCTLRPDVPTYDCNGVNGAGFTATGCDISAVVDGFGVWLTQDPDAANVSITGNYVHDVHCQSSPYHSDGVTHNDGVQIHGGGPVVIRGNTFIMNPGATSVPVTGYGATSCVLASDGIGTLTGIVIEDNYFDYSAALVNINPPAPINTLSTATIRNNRFGRNGKTTGAAPTAVMILESTWTFDGFAATSGDDVNNGNVYDDDGSPIPFKRW